MGGGGEPGLSCPGLLLGVLVPPIYQPQLYKGNDTSLDLNLAS